jgi:hypothetical protein
VTAIITTTHAEAANSAENAALRAENIHLRAAVAHLQAFAGAALEDCTPCDHDDTPARDLEANP